MVKRYRHWLGEDARHMVESFDGDYVLYTDHAAAIKVVINDILGFIPEGWGMPLGWSEFINQLKEDSDGNV